MTSIPTSFYRFLSLSATILLFSGCFHAGDLTQLKRDIDRDLPEAHFKRQVQFTVGPMSLGFVRLLSLLAPNIDPERDLLKEIDRVAIAVYKNEGSRQFKGTKLPRAIYDLLERGRWQMAVKVREKDELVWVLYQVQDNQVRDLYFVVLSDELILVRLEGQVDQLVLGAVAMRHHLSGDKIKGQLGLSSNRNGRNGTLPDFWQIHQEGLVLAYNRVDGLYAGWHLPTGRHLSRHLLHYGQLGRALHAGVWHYQGGIEIPLSFLPARTPLESLVLGAELHKRTHTQDTWLMASEENSLLALLLRQDYRDYYRDSGYSFYLSSPSERLLHLSGRLSRTDFATLHNQVDWGMVGSGPGRANFRPNPAVDPIEISSLQLSLKLDSRNRPSHPGRGWYATALVENAGDYLQSGPSFSRYLADLRRYQPLGRLLRLDLRLRLGILEGSFPRQYRFALGGLSTLRGYPFKAFSGDRLVLFNGELWTDPSRLALPHWPRGLKLGTFFDTGSVWSKTIPLGEPPTSDKADFNTSLGLALDYEDLHLYFARALDAPKSTWEISARLSRPF